MDIDDVLRALNGNLSGPEWNTFWSGSHWSEIDDKLPADYDADLISRTWIAQRDAALDIMRRCVDEWVNSGRRTKGMEAVRWRSLTRSPLARATAAAYWETSRIQQENDSVLRLLPPRQDRFGFDYAEWKAQQIVAVLLASDWRLQIARCRYPKCKQPYFLLEPEQTKRTYQDGIFCQVPNHRRIVAAARHLQDYRKAVDDVLVEWAADYLERTEAPTDWHEKRAIKAALASHLQKVYDKRSEKGSIPRTRSTVKANWVTRHWKDIQKHSKRRK